MTTIKDLDECRYFAGPGGVGDEALIAIGWLGSDAPFSTGEVDNVFLAKLKELCDTPWEPLHAEGWHECELCRSSLSWSSCNLFVPYRKRVYASPEGIVHYISSHRYRPPDIFVEAVLACPPMRSREYFDALRENGGPSILAALRSGTREWEMAHIWLDAKHNPLAFLYANVTPTITVNGEKHRLPWGTHDFEVPPGECEVSVSYPWLSSLECGKSTVQFIGETGKFRRVRYCARFIPYIPGKIDVK